MQNKKGFIGGLIGIIVAVAIICAMYFWWQKMSAENLQRTIQKASQESGIDVNIQDASPQGQVNALRDMVGKIQDKKNTEIEEEMKK